MSPSHDRTNPPDSSRTPAANAELALLLEVAGTPKPGNVDRRRDFPDLRFEHFLAGAVGARPGLERAERGEAIGATFERAVEGMAAQRGGNTQFGSLLLLVPLVAATRAERELDHQTARSTVEATTVEDSVGFYRAFDHVDVFVDDPPADLEPLDARRGKDAIPALEERGITLYDVMDASVPGDDVAREWVTGFERSFETADRLAALDPARSATDRVASVFLSLLAERPDTLIEKRHGETVAADVTDHATDLLESGGLETVPDRVDAFAADLVDRGVNPGTTADITAAGLFIALDRGGFDL
ncbi:triphosphoribosyl-dephospho-CoA synthase [Natronosalvus vescus]|uniref:triphosphoribosyl-dephospho-CoA synthase n=1 Tax=Natronosalvus vescus TaxID=2953881 RepID=UPI002091968A|nr:triphosphoribosyl-dephospho-CoA synthase [Natronosalvus vescus]